MKKEIHSKRFIGTFLLQIQWAKYKKSEPQSEVQTSLKVASF